MSHANSPRFMCNCGREFAERAFKYHSRYCGALCQIADCGQVQQNMHYCRNHYPVYRLAKKFHLSFDELYQRITASGYKCEICTVELDTHGSSRYGEKTACVDHCHASGQVRGILCQKCNGLLGYADDSSELLRKMAQYLESSVDLRPAPELRATPTQVGMRYGPRWTPQGPECREAGCFESRKTPHSRCKRHNKMWVLARTHGLTVEVIESTLITQRGHCPVCGLAIEFTTMSNSPLRTRTHVDHDHSTGRVRGIICGRCNSALPYAQDDPVRLRAAADYLERTQ